MFVFCDADLFCLVEGMSFGSMGVALILPDDIEDVACTFWLFVDLFGWVGVEWCPDSVRMVLVYVVY